MSSPHQLPKAVVKSSGGPCGGVMWILCNLASGSTGAPKIVFASLRSTQLEDGVPRD